MDPFLLRMRVVDADRRGASADRSGTTQSPACRGSAVDRNRGPSGAAPSDGESGVAVRASALRPICVTAYAIERASVCSSSLGGSATVSQPSAAERKPMVGPNLRARRLKGQRFQPRNEIQILFIL